MDEENIYEYYVVVKKHITSIMLFTIFTTMISGYSVFF